MHRMVLLWLVAAVFLQGILYISILSFNGGFKYLEENAGQRMVDTTFSRSSQLENLMVHSWSNISDFEWRINRQIESILEERGLTAENLAGNDELNQEIIWNTAEIIVEMLRQTKTNEAFIILCGSKDADLDSSLCGFHIRDLDPSVNLGRDDLLLETGSAELAGNMGIALDSLWESRFQTTEMPEFYIKTISAARTYSQYDSSDLGHWSKSFQWRENDWPLISYSMPLMDQENRVYGVIGVSVSEDYLKSLMPVKELDSGGTGAYILAKTQSNGQGASPVAASGLYRTDMFGENGLEVPTAYKQVFDIKGTELSGTANLLNLYKRSSPFYGEKWFFQSVMPREVLFQNANYLRTMMGMAFMVSIGIGCIIAVFASYYLTGPISKLARDIRQQEIDKRFENIPSGIREIDELREAISVMDGSIRDNSSRLSRIIKLVNLPLGAIEYSEKDRYVYCTDQVISVLQMEPSEYRNGAISKQYFEEFWENAGLEGFLKESGEIEFHVQKDHGERWIHIESWVENQKTFIIVMDKTEDIIEKQQLEYERDYDILTNLLSRRAFDRKVQNILENKKDFLFGAMIMWDLDNLKYINDTYGHDYGDKYIQKAARIFGSLAAEYPGAVVSRISGDEFMAFIPECRDRDKVLETMDAIRKKLHNEKLEVTDGEKIALRASGGIAWYPKDGRSLERLKKCADFAMYDTKTSYKGFYKQYNQEKYDQNSVLLEGQEELNKIIEGKQVDYHFQPIVSTTDGTVFAYEALMRPRTKTLRNVSDVMRLASDQSRLGEIELLTFERAFYFRHLQKEAFGEAKLFVNSIPNQRIKKEVFDRLCETYPENKGRVVVEIIEGEHTDAETLRKKRVLNEKFDWEVALDDFGSGYSTEETLLYLHPQYVKIDMVLIQGICSDKDKQSLVKNFLSYAHPRNIRVVAEGVETYEDMETVIRLGVDFIQGDYLGKAEGKIEKIPGEKVGQIIKIREELAKEL